MEGVTDAPMRALMSERGGFTFCVSEFLRVNEIPPPAKVFRTHIPELLTGACVTPSGVPIQIQLLGGDPEMLAQAAQTAVAIGAHAIDLNFGCPAPTVNRHDGGATLLKFPDRIETIVRSVRSAVPAEIPVSAKLRLGWDSIEQIHLNAERAARGGASWITIHARTRMQAYNPPVYWEPIGQVRRALDIPVVANGDIWTLDDFKRCREQTACDHFMLGRSALADPTLALRISRELGITAPEPAKIVWHSLIRRFSELSLPYSPENHYTVSRIKQWFRICHRRGEAPWFDVLKRLETIPEVLNFLEVL